MPYSKNTRIYRHMKNKKLIPTVGFGSVRFGMTIKEVKDILGKPDSEETESLGNDPDDVSTELIYDELGLSLSFDKMEGFKLVDIMTEEDSQFTLGDNIKLGDSLADVRKAASEADYGPFEELDVEDDLEDDDLSPEELENAKQLAEFELPEVGVNLYFRGGVLDTIQIGPEYDDNDNIIWPKK